jgi:hypothetical protein
MAYLYLLVRKDGTTFKIGRANEVWKRATQVAQIDDIDLGASYVVSGEQNINRLEKTLHYLFDFWASPGDEGQDGRTEWFKSDALKDTIDILKFISSLRKHQDIVLRKGINPTDSWVIYKERQEERKRSYEQSVIQQRKSLVRMARLVKRYAGSFLAYSKFGSSYYLAVGNYGDSTRRTAGRLFDAFRISLPNCGLNLITSMSSDEDYFIFNIMVESEFFESNSVVDLEPELGDLKQTFISALADVDETEWVREHSDETWQKLFNQQL